MLELEKMLQGKIYNPNDEEILSLRNKAHALCAKFNRIEDDNDINRNLIIGELIPHNNNLYLQGPIYFDYGINTHFGKNCYANFNFTVLDICSISIGDNVVIAAGSVVTHNIPSNTLLAGNPCKVIRNITKEDSIYLKKELF